MLGGHLDRSSRCDFTRPSYNSCRNRHCPKCQALAQERWVHARSERVLPAGHFHLVFTMPVALHSPMAFCRMELAVAHLPGLDVESTKPGFAGLRALGNGVVL